uniref:BZIP domain-containing protein n=1 Tax=Caenorhabditis tropicalis TaxID=1561998 RepID=A0A1I7US35_9PELO
MDFNDSLLGPNIEEFLRNPDFPPQFDELELDSLLYGTDGSQESSPSSSFGFNDQNAGFRSRDGGSLGDSSSDSSPPLSCANFTETDQEMWDFGFQTPNPFDNIDQQFGNQYHEEEVIPQNEYMNRYVEEKPVPQKQIIKILPNKQPPVKRVFCRPIQKFYRVKEYPGVQQQQTYRVVQPTNTPAQPQRHVKQMYYTGEQDSDIYMQPQSGPLIRHEEPSRYVPIAPTKEIKQEQTIFTSEQNRKIRNRMYAQASRIRKKEFEESLKQSLQEALNENEILKTENQVLKQRLAFYEPEDFEPRPAKSHKQRKMIAAGTVLMMFGLFAVISPFNIDNQLNSNPQILAIPNETSIIPRHSRVITYEDAPPVIKKPQQPMNVYSNSSQSDCDMYKLNATETLRVNNDIERWVQVHSFDNVPMKFSGGLLNKEAMKKFNDVRKQKTSAVFGPQTRVVQKKTEQAALRSRERTWRQLDLLKTGNDIQVDNEKIQKKSQDIDRIASIVRQKGDTLYIMTLQDYVLLPSLKKGANSIPKLSLLLPSVPMNGTLLDQYTLLRVDCEVTGTGQLTLSNKQLSYLMP